MLLFGSPSRIACIFGTGCVACSCLVLTGCVAALEGGLGLEGAAFARAAIIPVAVEATVPEVVLVTTDAVAVDTAAASTLRIAGGGIGSALTEARIAAIARSAGLPGVLDEVIVARSVVRMDAVGRISAGGRYILNTESGLIRLPSSGEVIGKIQGSRILATDATARTGIEVGNVVMPDRPIHGDATMEVSRIRPGWYQVVVGGQGGGGSALALLALAGSNDDRTKIGEKPSKKEAIDAQVQLLLDEITKFEHRRK